MYHTVRFTSESPFDYAVDINKNETKTDLIETIRDSNTKVSFEEINNSNDNIHDTNCNPKIPLTNEIVKLSGHFTDKIYDIKVLVKEKFLNQFLYEQIFIVRNNTGKVRQAWMSYCLDQTKVITAWKEAGFPMIWNK